MATDGSAVEFNSIQREETSAQVLEKMTPEEIFKGINFGEIKRRKDELSQACLMCAVTSVGPAYITERLWPRQRLGKSKLNIEGLRPTDRIWFALNDAAKAIIGQGAVNEEVIRTERRRGLMKMFTSPQIIKESQAAAEAIAVAGKMDFHFQDTAETFPGTLTNYWETLIVLFKKLGVEHFSLHAPYLRNRNLEGAEGGKPAMYNLAQLLISGFIPKGEVDRLRAEAIADGRFFKGLIQDRVTSTERLFEDWLGLEKKARSQESFDSIKKQIDWFKAMRKKYDIKGNQITVHMVSVGDEGIVELSDTDFNRGLKCLKQLREYAGDEIELLVETQGLSRKQWERIFEEIPGQKVTFDIAHVRIEPKHYGDIFAALEQYKDRIGLIHFSQPIEEGGRIVDDHTLLPADERGVFTDEDKRRVIKFAVENKIWVTFESGFTMADVQKIEEWARAELPKPSN